MRNDNALLLALFKLITVISFAVYLAYLIRFLFFK